MDSADEFSARSEERLRVEVETAYALARHHVYGDALPPVADELSEFQRDLLADLEQAERRLAVFQAQRRAQLESAD